LPNLTQHYNLTSQRNRRFSRKDSFSETDYSRDGSYALASGSAAFHPIEWAVIINHMARGWESKSVEAQQDEAAEKSTPEKPRLTREAAARLREMESLRLSLQNVLQQIEHSHSTRYRSMLEQARSDLERKIQELGV
jgi:hypothetical protein